MNTKLDDETNSIAKGGSRSTAQQHGGERTFL